MCCVLYFFHLYGVMRSTVMYKKGSMREDQRQGTLVHSGNSKALTWHYSHAIGSRIQKRGKVIRCRRGLLLACTKVWGWKNPDLRQQDQSNRGNAVPIELCWEWKQRGPKRNIHLGGGKGKVIAEQQRMVEADGWVQWTCGGQWSERERERERSVRTRTWVRGTGLRYVCV